MAQFNPILRYDSYESKIVFKKLIYSERSQVIVFFGTARKSYIANL